MTTAQSMSGSLPVRPAPSAVVPGFVRARILGAPAVSKKRKALAFTIAVAADAIQLVLWPAFSGGAASPFEDALDVVVGALLLLTLGFSGRLALAFAMELIPGADLFPTWSAVVASIPSQEAPRPEPARV